MAKGFAIAAFVFVLISFPIPILGNYLTLGALILTTVAALAGDKAWTIAITIISGVKLFFLSPTWHLMMFGGAEMNALTHSLVGDATGPGTTGAVMQGAANQMSRTSGWALPLTLAFLAAPLIALAYRQMTQSSQASPAE